jgi:hypothetical protein
MVRDQSIAVNRDINEEELMSKTLEKMQAAGLADGDEGVTALTDTDAELELVTDDEPNGVVPDGEEEGTIALVGDDQDHSRVEVPKKTLSQLRRTRREAREQVQQKDSENSELRAELDALKKATLKKPMYTDFATDEAFEAALLEYHSLTSSQRPPAQATPAARPHKVQGPDFSAEVNAHIDRAEALGVNLDKFAQADRAVRTTLGDPVVDAIIASVGAGSEKALMLIGSNPTKLAEVQQMLTDDPTGLRVVSHLARLAATSTVRKKAISDAPRATRSPTGGLAVSAEAGPYNKRLAKAEKSGDVQGMVEIRREARKAGVTL